MLCTQLSEGHFDYWESCTMYYYRFQLPFRGLFDLSKHERKRRRRGHCNTVFTTKKEEGRALLLHAHTKPICTASNRVVT